MQTFRGNRTGWQQVRLLGGFGFLPTSLSFLRVAGDNYEYSALDCARDRAGACAGVAHMCKLLGEIEQADKELNDARQRYKNALDFYQKALDFYPQEEDRAQYSEKYSMEHCTRDRAGACVGAAHICKLLGEIEQADKELDDALQHYDAALGFYLQASDFYQQILDSYQQAGDRVQYRKEYNAEDCARDRARASSEAAHVYEVMSASTMEPSRKRLGKALKHYDTALGHYKAKQDLMGIASVCRVRGDVLKGRQKWNDALRNYTEALDLYLQAQASLSKFQEQENLAGQAYTYQAIGDVLNARKGSNDLENALQNYEQALLLYRRLGDIVGRADVYKAMGDVQKELAELGKTSEDYRASYREALNLLPRRWKQAR